MKELRERRGDKLAVFAKKAKLTRAYLQKVESGEIGISIDMQFHLAKAFDISFPEFMGQVERHRTEFTERAYDFDAQILEDGKDRIMVVTRVGRIDANKEVEYIKRVYTHAKQQDVFKVLFHLGAAHCDFSNEEEWEIAVAVVEWFREQSYWPVVAVVRNSTLGGFGAKQAARDGLRVQMFWNLAEAHDWLDQQDSAHALSSSSLSPSAPYMRRPRPI